MQKVYEKLLAHPLFISVMLYITRARSLLMSGRANVCVCVCVCVLHNYLD